MSEELLKIILNYGIPAFLTIYVTLWLLNKGVPLLDKWVGKYLQGMASKYDNLSQTDKTLNNELKEVIKDLAVIKHELIQIRNNINAITKKQDWEERKIVDILNGLGYTKGWDDPKPSPPLKLPFEND